MTEYCWYEVRLVDVWKRIECPEETHTYKDPSRVAKVLMAIQW